MIREMVRWSQNNSDLPESFAGRYLQERVRRRDPNVNLAAGAPPSEIHFNSLDILVLTAFFDRGVTPSSSDTSGPSGKPAALDPCSQFRSSLGIAGGDLSHATVNEVRRRLVELATKKAGAQGAPGSFGDAIQALRVLDRLVRLFTLYSTASITIDVLSDNPIHKPTSEVFGAFKARVGVSEEEWQSYVADRDQETVRAETALSDCLDQLGLPAPPGLGRIAAALAGWRVEWRAVQGMPEHAVIEAENSDFDLKGQYQHNVKRISDYTGETKPLIVRIKPERREDHEGNAPQLTTPVTVRADLETSARPSLQTLISAARGGLGLISSLVELFSGWAQEMWTPQAYATLSVTYHHRARYRVSVEGEQKRTWSVNKSFSTGKCLYGTVGSGTETALFTSTHSQVVDVEKDGYLSQSPIVMPLTLILQRSGQLDLSTAGPASHCVADGTGDGTFTPPPPDCGLKRVMPAYVQLEYAEGRVTLAAPEDPDLSRTWNPYRNCDSWVDGLAGPPGADISASVSADKVKQGEAVVAAIHTTIKEQTSEKDIVTTLRWVVTFTPIDRYRASR